MVTLALISMLGMMGLAVDLGWSYFVQKEAQAAADTAALAAAQEAVNRLGVGSDVSGFNCGSTGTSSSQVECTEAAGASVLTSCKTIANSDTNSNLYNGCLYAKKNGFDYSGSNPIVTMQSGDVTDTNAPPGVKRISYWVRVRVIQTIPQLFSAVIASQGTVAANATAAIAGVIKPGSFYGMNHAGDCMTGSDAGNCGLDFLTGHGKGKGSGGSQQCGSVTSDLCAPAGVVLASSCNDSSSKASGCDQAAGIEQGAGMAASSLTIMGPAGAVDGTTETLSGGALNAVNTTNAATFQDPTAPNAQPPLATSAANIGTCAIPSNKGVATIPGNINLGPYLYYSYHSMAGGKPVPDGNPIAISGTATFSQGAGSAAASASCPAVSAGGFSTIQTGGAANQTNANFPTYIFVGGLTNNGTMTLGPGQVVMAGTNSSSGYVFDNEGTIDGTSSAAQATGSMFLFTDAAYPGMNLSSNTAAAFTPLVSGATGTALYQGTIALNGDTTMYGLVNSTVSGSNLPASLQLNAYTGVVFWQDRRNSTVGYSEASGSPGCDANCTGDNGSVISCAIGCPDGSTSTPNVLATANHVTANSPGVQWGNGNGKVALNGVYYQPRGAWIHIGNGNTGFNCPANSGACPLQLITGAVIMDSGNTRVVLAGASNPLISYKAVLIQ